MDNMKKNRKLIQLGVILNLVIVCYYGVPSTFAREYSLTPSLGITAEYNDNVAFDRTNERDDFLTIISPEAEFSSETVRGTFHTKVKGDIFRYLDETDENTENLYLGFDGAYDMTERAAFRADASYIADTTLESELMETGVVNVRSDRQRTNGGVGFTYTLSPRANVGIDYKYSKTDYDRPESEDYDYNLVRGNYNYHFNTQVDTLTLQPYYSKRDSDIRDADTYGITLGWTHLFSETDLVKIFLGTRYTDQEKRNDSDESFGGTADISLLRTGEVYSAQLGYSRDIHNDVSGDLIEVDRIYCRLSRKIVGRLSVGFSGNFYFTRSEDDSEDDTRYFEVIPSLDYQLTKHHTLRLAYSYSEDDDEAYIENKSERSRVWIAVNFNFPYQWQ